MNRIKILQIGKYYPPYKGGFENSLHALVEMLKDRFQFQILVANTDCKTTIERLINVTVIRLGSLGKIFSQPLTLSLFFWLKRSSCDVTHIHLPNPLAMIFYLIASPSGKLVVSYHNDIIRQRALMVFLKPMVIALLRRAQAIVVTSDNLINSSDILRMFRYKCYVVAHGIDADRFKATPEIKYEAEKIRERLKRPIVLFVGRLVYYKGLKYLIQAMKDIEAALMIVGAGPEGRQLKTLAKVLGVQDKIIWLGEVSDEELPAYYQACDLFVLPSCANSESFGLVILEAHSFAKPVVSTNLPTGVIFTNLHQKTGLVVSPKDSDSLKEAVNLLLASKELRDKYGEYARKRVGNEFTKEKMAQEIARVYESVMLCNLNSQSAA